MRWIVLPFAEEDEEEELTGAREKEPEEGLLEELLVVEVVVVLVLVLVFVFLLLLLLLL